MPDILDSITAIHSREERYAKLELLYRSQSEREKIFDAISKSPVQTDSRVEVGETKESEQRGIIFLEFHDDYDKESGELFDIVIAKLGIDRCV